jgi:hypothetical protein
MGHPAPSSAAGGALALPGVGGATMLLEEAKRDMAKVCQFGLAPLAF